MSRPSETNLSWLSNYVLNKVSATKPGHRRNRSLTLPISRVLGRVQPPHHPQGHHVAEQAQSLTVANSLPPTFKALRAPANNFPWPMAPPPAHAPRPAFRALTWKTRTPTHQLKLPSPNPSSSIASPLTSSACRTVKPWRILSPTTAPALKSIPQPAPSS